MQVVNSQVSPFPEKSAELSESNQVPATINMALFTTYKSNEEAIDDICHYIVNNLSDIIQLPELFFIDDKMITNNVQELLQLNDLCKQVVRRISAELRPFQYICTSLIIDSIHQAVLISEHGVVASQKQIQPCERYPWTKLTGELSIIELPLEQGAIKVAMLTGDDASSKTIVDTAAMNHIHLLLVPFDIQTPCEVENHLLSRAAERKICIAAATREKSFIHKESSVEDNANLNSGRLNKHNKQQKIKSLKSTGFIVNLPSDIGLLAQNDDQKNNSSSQLLANQLSVSQLIVKHQQGKITKALVHPMLTCV